jgi:hypothetical protein
VLAVITTCCIGAYVNAPQMYSMLSVTSVASYCAHTSAVCA